MYLDGHRKSILDWVAAGLSDREIAERVRVSPSTVRYWRERNGVTRPPRATGPKLRKPDAGDAG
ncbi:MAG: helix-turn-helix domain-containing protein [Isosphaeraceae bacterium]